MVDAFLVVRLLQWFRRVAYREQPEGTGSALIFRVSRPARYFFAGGILLVAAVGALSFLVADVAWYIRFGFIPIAAFMFTRWPWALKLGAEGVSRRSYLGVAKTIPWADVTALLFARKSGIFTVVAKDGRKIRCSAFMASPAVFYAEMHKHAHALGPIPTRLSDGLPPSSSPAPS